MPLVSFVIPCYRQARFLAEAVRSVLSQTLGEVEAIVVDDGSPDDVPGHLGDLVADRRVTCLRQDNRGLAAARNAGLENSSGVMVSFLDADDWIAPTFCERLQPTLAGGGIGFAYCDVTHVRSLDGGESPNRLEYAPEEYSVGKSRRILDGNILPSLLIGGYFPPAAALVRRSVLERCGGFDPELGGHADWHLWMRISAAGFGARYVDERLAFYRLHGGNMSRDEEHMRSTRLGALRKLFRASPDAAAAAIDEVCRSNHEQFSLNQELSARLTDAAAETENLRSRIQWLEETKRSLEQSTGRWRDEAERLREVESRFDAYFREAQPHIEKLDQAARWHEEQSRHWQSEAGRVQDVEQRFAQYFQESQGWIRHLEAAETAYQERERSLRHHLGAVLAGMLERLGVRSRS